MRDLSSVYRSLNNPETEHPNRSRFGGVHYGLVEANDDPLKLGRLKIRTPVFFNTRSMPTDSLPWANYASPSGGIEGTGFYSVPPVGAQVAVTYVDSNPAFPVWIGTVWGAPNDAPESYVNTIDASNPYRDEGVDAPGWDFRRITTLTTQGGNKFVMDDNLVSEAGVTPVSSTTDFRRIELETPGDFILTLGGVSPFTVGSRVLGQTSGASGLIFADEGTEITLTSVRGQFEEGEVLQDGEENQATVSSIEARPGYYLRLREDKLPADTPLSELVGEDKFRGAASLGTSNERELILDDQDETIRVTTPDSHYFEINSKDDFIKVESEAASFIEINDPEEFIRIATPGDDEVELGYSIWMDQISKSLTVKGVDNELYLKLDESGDDELGIYNNFNNPKDTGIAIDPFYPSGASDKPHVARMYSGSGPNENGVICDRGSLAGSRPQAVYMYSDDADAPTHFIRLVTDSLSSGLTAGRIDIGNRNQASSDEFIVLDPGVETLVNGSEITMTAGADVLIRTLSGGASGIKIQGPWVSEYFNHKHFVDLQNPENIGNLEVSIDSGSSFGTYKVLQLAPLTTEPVRSGT